MVGILRTDALGLMSEVNLDPLADVDASAPDLTGLSFDEAIVQLSGVLGPHVWIAEEADREGRIDHTLFFGQSEYRDKTGVVVRMISSADEQGGVSSLFAIDPVMATAAVAAR